LSQFLNVLSSFFNSSFNNFSDGIISDNSGFFISEVNDLFLVYRNLNTVKVLVKEFSIVISDGILSIFQEIKLILN